MYLQSISCFLLIVSATAHPAKPAKGAKNAKNAANGPTKYLFSFGDSYTQTAFDVAGTKPAADNPIGNPPYPGATFSGGANWIDYLVTTYQTSPTLSYNFAYGGATVDASLDPPNDPTIHTIVDQINIFNRNLVPAPSYAPWTPQNSLFAIWIGINDVAETFTRPDEVALLGKIMDSYFAQVQIIYNSGARNFLFVGVPPTNKTPDKLTYPPDVNAHLASTNDMWNGLLVTRVNDFQTAHADVKIIIFDTQPVFNTAIANPTAYGAPDALCVNPDGVSCLWWNSFHPGMAIHKLVAAGVADAIKASFI